MVSHDVSMTIVAKMRQVPNQQGSSCVTNPRVPVFFLPSGTRHVAAPATATSRDQGVDNYPSCISHLEPDDPDDVNRFILKLPVPMFLMRDIRCFFDIIFSESALVCRHNGSSVSIFACP